MGTFISRPPFPRQSPMPSPTEPLDVAEILETRATRRLGHLAFPENGEETPARLPVAVITGKRDGSTVWVNASIHGDEYLGPAAVARLIPTLDPSMLSGNLILTPVLNVPAFLGMRRTDPGHDVDLNRAWSGGGSAGTTTRTRDRVATEILERCDAVIDLHSGGNRYMQAPFTVYPCVGGKVEAASAEMAKACGLSLIWADATSYLEGALIRAAAKRGKPSILVEVAGEGKAEDHWVARTVQAVRGALAQRKVLRDDPNFISGYRVFRDFTVVKNREEGLWERRVDPVDDVDVKETMGRVLDSFGHELESVRSPVEGVVLGMYTYGYVAGGELISELGHGFRKERPPR